MEGGSGGACVGEVKGRVSLRVVRGRVERRVSVGEGEGLCGGEWEGEKVGVYCEGSSGGSAHTPRCSDIGDPLQNSPQWRGDGVRGSDVPERSGRSEGV